jgi:hypothetical protein
MDVTLAPRLSAGTSVPRSLPCAVRRRRQTRLPPRRIALLVPWIAAHVVAIALPEAGAILRQELQAAHPLDALPEVQVRHDETQRIAVLRLKGPAIMAVGEEVLLAQEVVVSSWPGGRRAATAASRSRRLPTLAMGHHPLLVHLPPVYRRLAWLRPLLFAQRAGTFGGQRRPVWSQLLAGGGKEGGDGVGAILHGRA